MVKTKKELPNMIKKERKVMRVKAMNFFASIKGYVTNEKGAQSLEWLGLAALLIMLLGFITAAFGEGNALKDIVNNIITSIGSQVGGTGGGSGGGS